MISGIGIDIIELDRINRAVNKKSHFINRILTEKERKIYDSYKKTQRKLEFLAGRFAAKEAFAKATGTGIGKLSFQHIEILHNDVGAPQITVDGYRQEDIFLSISHSKQYAVAQVIITNGIK